MLKPMIAGAILAVFSLPLNAFADEVQTEMSAKIEAALHTEAKTHDSNLGNVGRQASALAFEAAQNGMKALVTGPIHAVSPLEFTVTPIDSGTSQFEGVSVLKGLSGAVCYDIELRVVGKFRNSVPLSYFVERVTLTPMNAAQCV